MKKVIYFLPTFLLFFSCAKEESENVNQDSIYTIYELFYNKDTDITTAKATFRFGGKTGTLLELNSPAISRFNGDDLQYNSFLGTHKKEYAGFTSSGTFSYTDLDNNSFTNAIPTIDTIGFPIGIDTISTSGAFTFVWDGLPVSQGETISLTINGTTGGNLEVFSTVINGNTQLILDMNKLQNLGIGDATCTLQRIYNKSNVDQGTSEGGRVATWYTAKKTIYIKN